MILVDSSGWIESFTAGVNAAVCPASPFFRGRERAGVIA
jgi:hypothetical protein